MVHILLADNHPIVFKGLESILFNSNEFKILKTISNGYDLLTFLKENDDLIDVVILEVDLPQLNGFSVLRNIKNDFPNTKVLVFSNEPDEVYAINALKAGAKGYINKNASIDELKLAIRKVSKNETYLNDELRRHVSKNGRGKKSDGYIKKLSTREIEVLTLLSNGKKNKEIAEELEINEKTVSTYKARLMRKLKVSNLVDLVNQAKHHQTLQHAI